jgi:tetratricopeptide (TPR) repeat protein
MSCPSRDEILAMLKESEDVPHLDECEACAEFFEIFLNAAEVFHGDRRELERALGPIVDEALAGAQPGEWASRLAAEPRFRHELVIREVLRRAAGAYENPLIEGGWTAAAVALCDAMAGDATPLEVELHAEVLKERAMALRAGNDLKGALRLLERARELSSDTPDREKWDAVISLCKAITYSEADLGQFDDACALADKAHAVFARLGDTRRALMARQTKAYALMAQDQHEAVLEIVLPLAAQFDATGSRYDAASAHHLAAHSFVKLGMYDEGLTHAFVAECGYEKLGNAVLIARVSHVAACALAGLGRFEEALPRFEQSANVVLRAGLHDVWVLDRLDYVTAALRDDPAADVRADVDAVAHVCFVIGDEQSAMRRQYAAEALDYMRRLAKRDELTADTAEYVRDFVEANMKRPPVRFVPPVGPVVVN